MEQHGFRINGSIEAASFNVTNEILKTLNNRLSVEGIFFDLEKAVDCVNYGILVGKLELYGTSGKFLTFIQPYFRGRYQKLLIDKINAYDVSSYGIKLQMGFFRVQSWACYFFLLVFVIYPK